MGVQELFQPDPTLTELELGLRRGTFGRYTAELRYQIATSAADARQTVLMPPIDLRELDKHVDPVDYGVELGAWLLGVNEVKKDLTSAIAASEAGNGTLRVSLSIADDASELHRVRWEMMRDPVTKALLFVGDNLVFSRYVSSADFRRVQRRARCDLRALAVIADPTDLGEFKDANGRPLSRVRVDDEEKRIRTALGSIALAVIPTVTARATLNSITKALRAQSYDILYLVCHGAIDDREPVLWLEKDDGRADVVKGGKFADLLSELRQRPSLVVLASCQSGGTGAPPSTTEADADADADAEMTNGDGALAALGPHLAREGIPAVLAMQGNVTVRTIEQFMPVFFRELAHDGQLDRAASVARGAVRDRPDAGVPVLSTRLKGGGIWYRVGWDTREGFGQWPTLRRAINDGKCTPILGPGLLEVVHGSRRDVARQLAEQFHFPLAPQDRDELPQVAQYRSVEQDRSTIISEYLLALCERIQARYADVLDPKLLTSLYANQPTDIIVQRCTDLLNAAWDYRRSVDAADSHQLLSGFPFQTFISTNIDPLLGRALRAATSSTDATKKKAPREEFFRWSRYLVAENPVPAAADQDDPTEAAPLLYQLFGRLSVPTSLVLTQDDYFDALITASKPGNLPSQVRTALTNRSLLFLGFNIDDWNFRVLFRFIVNLEGSELLRNYRHVAVQIDPEEQRFYDPRAARRYLARYFGEQRIEIFWGSVDDFIEELKRQYDAGGRGAAAGGV